MGREFRIIEPDGTTSDADLHRDILGDDMPDPDDAGDWDPNDMPAEEISLGNPHHGEGGRFAEAASGPGSGAARFYQRESVERQNSLERLQARVRERQVRLDPPQVEIAEGTKLGPHNAPLGKANDKGEAAFFIGYMDGWDTDPMPLYNILGGDNDGSTVSTEGLKEAGIHLPHTPKFDQGKHGRQLLAASHRVKIALQLKQPVVINLPVAQDVSRPSMIGAIASKPPKKRKSITWHGLRLSRRPTAFEARVLSLSDIQTRFQVELDRTVDELLELRVQSLRGNKETDRLTFLALTRAQTRIAEYGAAEVRLECSRQGVVINLSAATPMLNLSDRQTQHLAATADLTASRLEAEWRNTKSVSRLRVLRAKGPRLQEDDVTSLAETKTTWGLKAAVRGILQQGFMFGRTAEMLTLKRRRLNLDASDDLVDYVIQSALLDTSCCDPCAILDGTIFEMGSEDQQEYEPPYYRCEGGDFCRCMQLAVVGDWRDRDDVEDAVDNDRIAVVTERQADRMIRKRQADAEDDEN